MWFRRRVKGVEEKVWQRTCERHGILLIIIQMLLHSHTSQPATHTTPRPASSSRIVRTSMSLSCWRSLMPSLSYHRTLAPQALKKQRKAASKPCFVVFCITSHATPRPQVHPRLVNHGQQHAPHHEPHWYGKQPGRRGRQPVPQAMGVANGHD